MKVGIKTTNHHALNADGTERQEHCCGCWDVYLDEDIPVPYAVCNECREVRLASFPGIDKRMF